MSSVVAIGARRTPNVILNENSSYDISDLNLGYFETKKRAEELALSAHREGSVEVFLANPATIYGAGDAEKGSRKNQIKVARGEMRFYTNGGVGVIHIQDVVTAIHKIIEKGLSGERFILNSENITIYELFSIIAEIAQVRRPSICLPQLLLRGLGLVGDSLEAHGRKFLVNSETAWTSTLFHWFDNSKMRTQLGLQPLPARKAIEDSIQWMKENGKLT